MEFMTVREAARKWGYAEATIRGWCKDGKLTVSCCAEKVSGRWRIPANAECPKPVKKTK